MKKMTVRALRHEWPKAEAILKENHDIVITKNGVDLARLSPIAPLRPKRKRFNPEEQARWRREIFGDGPPLNLVAKAIADDRNEP